MTGRLSKFGQSGESSTAFEGIVRKDVSLTFDTIHPFCNIGARRNRYIGVDILQIEPIGLVFRPLTPTKKAGLDYLFRERPGKNCSFPESSTRSLERALARRDITVPAGHSNMAAIS